MEFVLLINFKFDAVPSCLLVRLSLILILFTFNQPACWLDDPRIFDPSGQVSLFTNQITSLITNQIKNFWFFDDFFIQIVSRVQGNS